MTVRDEIDKVIQEVYEQGVRDGMTLGMEDTLIANQIKRATLLHAPTQGYLITNAPATIADLVEVKG
jgi:hypothetical protein